MKVVVQRVSQASVQVEDKIISKINQGYLLLVGFHQTDTMNTVSYLARKIAKLRVFSDSEGKMNKSIQDIDGEILSVSQFTLYGDTTDGNRPSFTSSMDPINANKLYDAFNQELKMLLNKEIQTGIFQAEMQVSLVNDGPVTILLERT
ncbi:MAG: D-tyrosyl-tRNA(Tyr) deacylase [Firmicutes bacterium]|nr:D-tyrosyl-tRNA(Tyr) deacylase [Bacillota bacterium]